MITANQIEALLDYQPQHPAIDPSYGPEPCLRALILNYYAPHFIDESVLEELVDTYCRQITSYAILEL